MSVPAFSDISKSANDVSPAPNPPHATSQLSHHGWSNCAIRLPVANFPHSLVASPPWGITANIIPSQLLNKDFYHLSAGTIEVKSNTPNNVAFKVTGKSSHDKHTSGAVRPPPEHDPLADV